MSEITLTDTYTQSPIYIGIDRYMKQIDWQLPGATDCHGHKDMHNSCQSTGSGGLAAAVSAKGRAGTCGMVPAAAGLFGYSRVSPDFPQLTSGPRCCIPSAAGG